MRGDVITMSHFFNKMVGLYLPSCSKLDQDQIWTAKKPWGAISIDLTMTVSITSLLCDQIAFEKQHIKFESYSQIM